VDQSLGPQTPMFTNSLGLEEMNPEGLNLPLTSGVFLGTHTLPTLSFSSGLTFGPRRLLCGF
jgi:hypothetical protein